ncbi:hypothetical protein [Catellatospora vulcania]|uniref:hypothetical protein n=1 Tax=Catellatospora vulcania TaxID=1460450 RepID=UPI0012D39725|nr:hypothetical protein [Catellatospora vulcania]
MWWIVAVVPVAGIFCIGLRGIELYVPEDWIVAKTVLKLAGCGLLGAACTYLRVWAEWTAARSGDPQRRAGAVRPDFRLRRPYWRYVLLASALPMFIVSVFIVHRLVPADWGWFWTDLLELALAVLTVGGAVLALKRSGPPVRPPAPATQTAPARPTGAAPRPSDGSRHVPSPRFGAMLVWHAGGRQCAVRTSARLRRQLLHLHLSSVHSLRIVDFVPAVGARVSVALGGEDSLVTIMSVGGDPLVVTMTPGGLAVAPVTRTDDGMAVFPPESAISVEAAIDVLDRYFITGELPARSVRACERPIRSDASGSRS